MKRTFNARPKQPPAHSGGKVNNLKTPFRNDIMVAGVVIANDTFGGDFDWLVGGDDDTFFFLSVLVPFLNSLDAEKPLFIGSPGPSYIGPWYCRHNTLDDDNHPESSWHRGPVCCANYSIPCPARLPPTTTSRRPGMYYSFAARLGGGARSGGGRHIGGRSREKLQRDGRTGLHSGEETRWRHWDHKNDCCSKNRSAAVPPRDLLLVATRCSPETCCQPEGGSAARLFHWSQGHYPYGGSGWALSRGLLRSPGLNARHNGGRHRVNPRTAAATAAAATTTTTTVDGFARDPARAHWLQCAEAVQCKPPDMGVGTCVLNAGYAIAAAPPHIFPPPVSSDRSAYSDSAAVAGTAAWSRRPDREGQLTSASMHHAFPQQVRFYTALDEAPSGSAARERLFWDNVERKCDCGGFYNHSKSPRSRRSSQSKRPLDLAARGKSCVASNCRGRAEVRRAVAFGFDASGGDGGRGRRSAGRGKNSKNNNRGVEARPETSRPIENCCRCREHIWRRVYSPMCESPLLDVATAGW